ncbi:MAG TPA: S41 family peptidase [Anaerohalosphaeraceae bacterium]|nr:S41 family peptidase [Anaerohalosphaeraceae bacterium]
MKRKPEPNKWIRCTAVGSRLLAGCLTMLLFIPPAAASDCNCLPRFPAESFSLQQAERTLLLDYISKGDFDAAFRLLEQSAPAPDDFHRRLRNLLSAYKTLEDNWRQENQQAAEKRNEKIRLLRNDPNQALTLRPEEALSLLVQNRQTGSSAALLPADPLAAALTEQLRRNILQWQEKGEYEKAWRRGLRVLLQADPDNPSLLQQKQELLSKIAIEKKLTAVLCPGQTNPYAAVQAETFYEALRRLDKKYVTSLPYPLLARRAFTCARHLGEVLACGRNDFLYSAEPNNLTLWNEHLKPIQETLADIAESDWDCTRFLEQIRLLLDLNRNTLRLPDGFLVQVLTEAVFEELDPYTELIWPARSEEFDKQMSGEFVGVGIRISRQDDRLNIVEIVPGSPAEESGILQTGDSILAIDGKPTENLSLDCAVRLISGPQGTPVVLTILREEKEITITIPRRKIILPSLHGNSSPLEQPIQSNGDLSAYQIDPDPRIAYIRISSFRKDTPQTLRGILDQFQQKCLLGLILDLRSNSGGLLDAAAATADLFLEKGTIVKICTRQGVEQEITASPDALPAAIPIVILVDGGTASGAEILAGALTAPQSPRAILVGTRTYGKGTIQEVETISQDGSRLKYTRGYFKLSYDRLVPNRYELLKQNRTDWGLLPQAVIEAEETQLAKAQQARQQLEKFFAENKKSKSAEHRQDILPLLESLLRSDPPLAAGLTILKAQILAADISLEMPADPNTPIPQPTPQ